MMYVASATLSNRSSFLFFAIYRFGVFPFSYCVGMFSCSVSKCLSSAYETHSIELTFVEQMSHKIIIKTDNPCVSTETHDQNNIRTLSNVYIVHTKDLLILFPRFLIHINSVCSKLFIEMKRKKWK